MKKKILFVTGNLSGGGAEKVISILASGCADLGQDVTLVILQNKKIVFPVSEKVRIIQLKDLRYVKFINRIIQLRRVIKQTEPNVIIPFLNTITVNTIIANWGLPYELIFSVRADPNIDTRKMHLKNRIGHFFMVTLKWNEKAKWTVFQTPDARECFSERIQEKSSVIYNPLDLSRLPSRYEGDRDKRIVAAGRLSKEKNFPLLITAFAVFKESHPEYTLTIYGEGSERNSLEELIDKLKLKDCVRLNGFSDDLADEIYKAGVYVSSSNHEGISNSMLEALGMGIPTIVTDCPIGGARLFVKTDENGILIPTNDKAALVSAMKKLVEDKEYAVNVSQRAVLVRKELSAEEICKKWIEIM